jgi:hypothetical protein
LHHPSVYKYEYCTNHYITWSLWTQSIGEHCLTWEVHSKKFFFNFKQSILNILYVFVKLGSSSAVFIHSHRRTTVLIFFFNLWVLPHRNSSSVIHDCYSYNFLPNHDWFGWFTNKASGVFIAILLNTVSPAPSDKTQFC